MMHRDYVEVQTLFIQTHPLYNKCQYKNVMN